MVAPVGGECTRSGSGFKSGCPRGALEDYCEGATSGSSDPVLGRDLPNASEVPDSQPVPPYQQAILSGQSSASPTPARAVGSGVPAEQSYAPHLGAGEGKETCLAPGANAPTRQPWPEPAPSTPVTLLRRPQAQPTMPTPATALTEPQPCWLAPSMAHVVPHQGGSPRRQTHYVDPRDGPPHQRPRRWANP